jgi:hypothetical protein
MSKLLRAGVLITFGMLIICIISACGANPPEEVTDSPQLEDDVPLSPITVVVDPAARNQWPPGVILPHTEFTLTFNEEVVAVTVNDTPASGSGLNWKWRAHPA